MNHTLDNVLGGGCATRVMIPPADGVGVASERPVAIIGLQAATTLPSDQLDFMILHEVGHIILGHLAPGRRLVGWRDEPAADAFALANGASALAATKFLENAWGVFAQASPGFLQKTAIWALTHSRLGKLQNTKMAKPGRLAAITAVSVFVAVKRLLK